MRLKKVKTLMVTGVMALMAVVIAPATAKAAHEVPNTDGILCDSTYFYREETGLTNIYFINHKLTDGRRCTISRMRYAHNRRCASCYGVVLRTEILDCTDKHTICPTYIRSCNSR